LEVSDILVFFFKVLTVWYSFKRFGQCGILLEGSDSVVFFRRF
jgi:hypothetical protein